jgi:hypothetical protein
VKPDNSPSFKAQSTGFAGDILETPDPNSYTVKLSWPRYQGVRGISIKRINEAGEAVQLDTIGGERESFVDLTAKPGHRYTYQLILDTGDGLRESEILDVIVPLDVEFAANAAITSMGAEIRRLFIRKGVVLTTEGKDTEIDVEQIIAEGGVIETRHKDAQAPQEQDGASGGVLSIRARSGIGALKVVAIGQQGGVGTKGSPGGPGGRGGKGHRAEIGHESFCPLPVNPMSILLDRDPPGRCHTSRVCNRNPGQGGKGGRGDQGGSGTPGRRGGDSAKVLVRIEDPAAFDIQYERHAGIGGAGGEGGDGGPGGPGGPPGDNASPCSAAGGGPQGDQGSLGPTGETGANGELQPVCIRLGQITFGDCQNFQ